MPQNKPFILLASQSPRRAELLRRAGYAFEVRPSNAEEAEASFSNVEEVVTANAKLKGMDTANKLEAEGKRFDLPTVLVAADTLVAMKGKVFPKPRDLNEAERFLSELGGRYHRVLTGVYCRHMNTGKETAFFGTTRVMLRKMSSSEIRRVFDLVNPLDKAGAYGYQDSEWIVSHMMGSPTNVIGLPMDELAQALTNLCGATTA